MTFTQLLGRKLACYALGASCLTASALSHAVAVDLLVLYDEYSRTYFNNQVETAMQSWVTQINSAYRDSNVDIQMRLVGVVAHQEDGADMAAVLGNLRVDATAKNLANQYGADFVSQLHQKGACGIAYMTTQKDWAVSVVGPQCGALTMAHELGHNMGLNHSRRQGDTGGAIYPYALGHGVDNLFGTIMTYSWLFNGVRIAKFSNPDINCLGQPCGVPVGQPTQAFAALAINNVKNDLAGHRPSVVVGASSSRQSSVASSRPNQISSSSSSKVAQSSSAPAGGSKCAYVVKSQWNNGFAATIRITNSGSTPINGWQVSWQYTDGSVKTSGWNANFTGNNPYGASNLDWNRQINPGQSIELGMTGAKPMNKPAQTPKVTGSVCN